MLFRNLINLDLGEKILNLRHGLIEGFRELVKIFFVQEDLMLLIFLRSNPLALCNGDVEVLFGFRGLHIEKVRPLPCTHSLRENFVLVVIFHFDNLPR